MRSRAKRSNRGRQRRARLPRFDVWLQGLCVNQPKRLMFIDNLKVVLTVLVIAHLVGQAYGPTGGWWPIQEEARTRLLGPFFSVNRSFFMSLFFMISAYFTAFSYERHGSRRFVMRRLVRLGVPLLAFFFAIVPLQQFLGHAASGDPVPTSFWRYYADQYLGLGERPPGSLRSA